MTEPRTGLLRADVDRVKDWLTHVVAEQAAGYVSTVRGLRAWCDRVDDLVRRCEGRNRSRCSVCVERARMSSEVRALLPAVPAVSGSQREEVDPVGTRVTKRGDDRDL